MLKEQVYIKIYYVEFLALDQEGVRKLSERKPLERLGPFRTELAKRQRVRPGFFMDIYTLKLPEQADGGE